MRNQLSHVLLFLLFPLLLVILLFAAPATVHTQTDNLSRTVAVVSTDRAARAQTVAHRSAATTTATVSATTTAAHTVTLRWFLRWNQTQIAHVARPLVERFEAAHPTVQVQIETVTRSSDYYTQLALQLAGGNPPDVFYPATHVAYDLAQRGLLLPLDEFLRRDAIDLTAYDSALLSHYLVDDIANAAVDAQRLYCLPIDQAALVVAYNRDLFDAAGVPYPQAPWQWADLQATAVALTQDNNGDGTPEQYGIERFYSYWPLLVWSATGHNVFDDPKQPTAFLLEEEDAVNAIQWLADLHLVAGAMPPPTGIDGVSDPFLRGKVAMEIAGHWRVPSYLAAGLNVDFAPLPQGEYSVNRNDGSCFAIAHQTAHAEAAWQFVQFLAGPNGVGAQMMAELQQITPALTALQTADDFLNPPSLPAHNLRAFLAPSDAPSTNVEGASPRASQPEQSPARTFPLYDPLHPIFDAWSAVAETELAAVWAGTTSADAAVGRMANQAEDLLEDLQEERDREIATATTVVDPDAANRQVSSEEPQSTPVVTTQTLPEVGNIVGNISTATLQLSITNSSTPPQTVLSSTLGMTPAAPTAFRFPRHLYVAPEGNDRYSGLRATFPLATLQRALELVTPGDTIHLAPGDYYENVTSVTHGQVGAPITIMGPADAVLRGNGDASAGFYLTHNYYTFSGFTMDGLHGDPDDKDGYTQKLLYVQGTGEKVGVSGTRVLNMTFRNAGGECVRFRYFAHHNEVAYSTFHVCGLLDYTFDDGGKNGEAIYIGTAPDQWADGKNPTADPDESHHNWVHHNVMDTRGNECAEIKEGGYGNIIEYNLCTGQLDPDSAGIGARGNHNIIRYNTIYSNVGAGVRLGGHEIDGVQYGINNQVYGNHLMANRAGGVKIINEPQRRICGNYLERTLGKEAFGEGSEAYDPTAVCS